MIDVRRRRRPTAPSSDTPLYADRHSTRSLTRIIAEVGGIEPANGKVVTAVAYSPVEHLSARWWTKGGGVSLGRKTADQQPAVGSPLSCVCLLPVALGRGLAVGGRLFSPEKRARRRASHSVSRGDYRRRVVVARARAAAPSGTGGQ